MRARYFPEEQQELSQVNILFIFYYGKFQAYTKWREKFNKSSYPLHSFNTHRYFVYIGLTYVMQKRDSEFTLKIEKNV